MTLKPIEHYENLKKYFNKNHNLEWKSIAGRPYIGSCSYLYKKYKPKTPQEFLDIYINDYDDTFNPITCIGNIHRGRSLEQLNILAQKYYDLCEDSNITLEECFDDLINHIIIETFYGQIVETMLSEMISKDETVIVEEMVDEFDAHMGIDIVVKDKKTNKVNHFIQVKPITTFIGNKNKSLKNDRINFFNKQNILNDYLVKEGRSDEIKNIEYVCYDKNLLMKTNKLSLLTMNGHSRFMLNELCDYRGYSKLPYKLEFKKIEYES